MLLIIALLTALAVVSLTMLLLQSNANSATLSQLDEIASIGATSSTCTVKCRSAPGGIGLPAGGLSP